MNTIQDFENAPVGAIATSPNGDIAINTGRHAFEWSLYDSRGTLYGLLPSDKMSRFTLNPEAPTTAREALDLAWNLAHPVKPGQVIPKGTRYLAFTSPGLREYTACVDREIRPELAPTTRTLDPLPDPEPDWLDAPAVMARGNDWVSCADPQVFVRENKDGTQWVRDTRFYRWDELIDVVPLYPKEDA